MTLQDIHAPTIQRPAAGRARAWLTTEEAKLKTVYPTATWIEIEQSLPGRTRSSIRERAARLGLKRPQRPPPILHPIIEAITIIRVDQNLSIGALAKNIGTDRAALSRSLSGRGGLPRMETLLRIVDALGCEVVIRPKEQAAA